MHLAPGSHVVGAILLLDYAAPLYAAGRARIGELARHRTRGWWDRRDPFNTSCTSAFQRAAGFGLLVYTSRIPAIVSL
jgi:hypothetical protein